MRESDLEDYLVRSAEQHGDELRKVMWIGRNKAPDRVLMRRPRIVPRASTVWIELKKPGGLATFPKNAHEWGQLREHERMRAAGQCVVVIDSKEGVDDLFA